MRANNDVIAFALGENIAGLPGRAMLDENRRRHIDPRQSDGLCDVRTLPGPDSIFGANAIPWRLLRYPIVGPSRQWKNVAGMELGRVIRKYRLRTDVGTKKPSSERGAREVVPGYCYSACALAYLGGSFRFLMKDSRYGVHRFAFENPAPQHADLAQIVSAAIVEYIRSMDVDTKLFSLSVVAGKDSVILSRGGR
jgi:hypothetical protein